MLGKTVPYLRKPSLKVRYSHDKLDIIMINESEWSFDYEASLSSENAPVITDDKKNGVLFDF
jgi:hypothetical protein